MIICPNSKPNMCIDLYSNPEIDIDKEAELELQFETASKNAITDFFRVIQIIIKEWHSARGTREIRGKRKITVLGPLDRAELYRNTEKQIDILKKMHDLHKAWGNIEPTQKLSTAIFEKFKQYPEWSSRELANWIAENSCQEPGPGMGFVGAYRPLHRLFKTLKKIINDPDGIHIICEPKKNVRPTGLAYIDHYALESINQLKNQSQPLVRDVVEIIYNQVGIKDLVALQYVFQCSSPSNRQAADETIKEKIKYLRISELLSLKTTNKCNHALVIAELIKRLNAGTNALSILSELKIHSVKELIHYFGSKCNEILNLSLYDWKINTHDFDELAKHCSNLTSLYLNDWRGNLEIANLQNKFHSLKCLKFRDFLNFKTITNILESCPSLTKLKFDACHMNNYTFLESYPSLTEIEFESSDIEDLPDFGEFAALEKISFTFCNRLKNISGLQQCKKLTHLSIFWGCDSFNDLKLDLNLPSLTHMHVAGQIEDYSFLKNSPNFNTLVIKNISSSASLVVPTIPSLELIRFPRSIIPTSQEIPSFTTLTLDTCYEDEYDDLDITKLNDYPSLETLRIQNCNIADFSVLGNHPKLKTLYIENCSNAETAQVLEDKDIKVVHFHKDMETIDKNKDKKEGTKFPVCRGR